MRSRTLDLRSACASAVLASAGLCSAALAQPEQTLKLKAGAVRAAALPNELAPKADAPLSGHALLTIDGVMDKTRRAALDRAGVSLLEYVPDRAYVVRFEGASTARLKALGFVRGVTKIAPSMKIAPDLGSAQPDAALAERLGPDRIAISVWGFDGVDRAALVEALRLAPDAELVSDSLEGNRRVLRVLASADQARALAASESVQWIEDAPVFALRNNSASWIIQSNSPGATPFYNAGITGAGQLVGLLDGRPDADHCSFVDPEGDPFGDDHRKVHRWNATTGFDDFHGTHVAGTLLGDAGVSDDTRGVAYEARMVFNICPTSVNEMSTFGLFQTHADQGAFVHNNSWGNDGTTAYDGTARAVDDFSWLNDDHLIVFACSNGALIRNPENSKNCLAVVSSGDASLVDLVCEGGAGPTVDGRRKPEITSPGCSIRSADRTTSCDVFAMTGTSMAAPGISGAAILARQYYADGFHPTGVATPEDAFVPTGPLLKATLLAGTRDMFFATGFPNDVEGWGRVQLDESLPLPGDDRALIVRQARNNTPDALSTGEVIEIPFDVDDPTAELRVVLTWHDAPASLLAADAAVNNLDLELVTPDFTYVGNDIFNGVSQLGGAADEINNVEVVMPGITSPGRHTVRVIATAVNQGAQGYAVTIRGDVAEPAGCSGADLVEPFDELDFNDVIAFLTAFGAQDPVADLAPTIGVFDFNDVVAYLNLFAAGCP